MPWHPGISTTLSAPLSASPSEAALMVKLCNALYPNCTYVSRRSNPVKGEKRRRDNGRIEDKTRAKKKTTRETTLEPDTLQTAQRRPWPCPRPKYMYHPGTAISWGIRRQSHQTPNLAARALERRMPRLCDPVPRPDCALPLSPYTKSIHHISGQRVGPKVVHAALEAAPPTQGLPGQCLSMARPILHCKRR